MASRPTIIPTLRYRDADAALAWLCDAFGFAVHNAFKEADKLMHAQLTLEPPDGHGMIMISPARDEHAFDAYQGPAQDKATMSAYIVVEDVEAHHQRAAAAGADVVLPVTAEHGGLLYSCRDLEGHLWNFGDYDPWAPPPEG